MGLNKEYRILEKDLKTALDHLDTFQTKMDLFTGKYPRFSYTVNVSKQPEGWLVLLNIKTKDEQRNTQTAQQTV
jgi:hypothetical protein